jgi:predicted DNA binding CopG/RHH family protein
MEGSKMKNKIKLDAFEQEIEDNADRLVPVSEKERKRIESIIEKARKNISISLRINNYDLSRIKERADRNGLPYQRLITTVLHKYINEEFYEKNEVIKTFKTLKNAI